MFYFPRFVDHQIPQADVWDNLHHKKYSAMLY